MNSFADAMKSRLERRAFGVCEWWGEKLRIPSADIRKFFIYTSCLTIGSPIILYLIMAFWKKLGQLAAAQRRGSVWDL